MRVRAPWSPQSCAPSCSTSATAARGLALASLAAALLLSFTAAAASDTPGTRPASTARSAAPSAPTPTEESGTVRWPEYVRRLTDGDTGHEATREMWREALAAPAEPRGLSTSAVNGWQLVGPLYSVNAGGGNMTGRVRDISTSPARVLAASGGLWDFDFGPIAKSDSVPATWFGSFAAHPYDANTILLGTGEMYVGNAWGTGLYKTTDGGQTWTRKLMQGFVPGAVARVRYSTDAAVVHAATDVGYFRSTNVGETWARTLTGSISDLTVVPGAPGWVFATVANGGLWRSLDEGLTWTAMTSGGLPAATGGAHAVTAIRWDGVVWVYVVFGNTGVWRSQDGGASWTNVSPSYAVSYSGYGPAISVCPTDPSVVLYGDVGYNRTANAGATWSKIATPHLHADYHVFAWDPNGVGVWAGHDGGWSHSTDAGLTWDTYANVMPVTQFYSVDTERNSVGVMIGGTQDNNTLFTPNQALFWSDPIVGSTEGDAFGTAIDGYDPMRMWSIAGVSGPPHPFQRYRTIDGGATWLDYDTGIDANNHWGGWIRSDNTFPVRLYTSTDVFVYESDNGGTSWTKANPTPFPATIRNLTASIRVSGGAVLYATLNGPPGQRLYVRDNGTWYERSAGLPSGSLVKVVPHPWFAYADEAWAVVNSSGAGNRIYHTTNRGQTWTNVSGDFPAAQIISDIVVNPRNSSQLFVGTMLGCWRSMNGGVNWERWNNGWPNGVIVTEMTYMDLTTTTGEVWIVAATYGRSVWKRNIAGEDPFPTLAIGDRMLAEDDDSPSSMVFKVELSAPSNEAVFVSWATADSTATAADGDYVPANGVLPFAPGATTAYLSVLVNGDGDVESDEAFKVVLSNPIRAGLAGGPAVGTIQDDDAPALVQQNLFVVDGTVNAIVPNGGTVYLGGSFTRVGPACGGGVPVDSVNGAPLAMPQVAGTVYAVEPDGAGGWFLGGSFSHVGGVPRANLAQLDASGQLTWWNPGVNGPVYALALDDGLLYVGGAFTNVGFSKRNHLAALDAATGVETGWNPNCNAAVIALVVGNGRVYIGGDFTTVNGLNHERIAAVNPASGVVDPWSTGAANQVSGLALAGSTLYACGFFPTMGGQPRNTLAALDAASGAVTGWNPAPDGLVRSFGVMNGSLYVAGDFQNIGGQARSRIAALDLASGLATPWNPNANEFVTVIRPHGNTVYAAGQFTGIGGQTRAGLAALDAASGAATAWAPAPMGAVTALGASAGRVFLGGDLGSLASEPRNRLAQLDVASGQVTGWNPDANNTVLTMAMGAGVLYAGGSFTTIGGQTRNRIAAIDLASGSATAWDPNASSTVRALLATDTRVYVGGAFTTIGGQARSRIASLSLSTGAALSWNPNANGPVYSLATDGTYVYAGGTFTGIGGAARTAIAQLAVSGAGAASPWNPSPNGRVSTMALSGSALYIGGQFTQIIGQTRNRGAVLGTGTQGLGVWNPDADDDVNVIVRNGAGETYVGGTFSRLAGLPRSGLAEVVGAGGSVTDWTPQPDGAVNALAMDGLAVYVGGSFRHIAGRPQSYFARLAPMELLDVADDAVAPTVDLALRLAPNPTRGEVRVEFALAQAGHVRVSIHDVQGRCVATPVDEARKPGRHVVSWGGDGGRPAPGLYFARVEAAGGTALRRFVVVR